MSVAESETPDARLQGEVLAALPLALLQATRAHDRPGEVLEEEDLTVSLPRRLGLSIVVETQIRNYETAARTGKRVSLDDFTSLLKLVLRRPDAEAILRDTGARVARHQFETASGWYVTLTRSVPRALAYYLIGRRARRLLRNITGSAHVDVHGKPLMARVHQPLTAFLEPPGTACALYAAAFEELATLYLRRKAHVLHPKCAIHGSTACQFVLGVD